MGQVHAGGLVVEGRGFEGLGRHCGSSYRTPDFRRLVCQECVVRGAEAEGMPITGPELSKEKRAEWVGCTGCTGKVKNDAQSDGVGSTGQGRELK